LATVLIAQPRQLPRFRYADLVVVEQLDHLTSALDPTLPIGHPTLSCTPCRPCRLASGAPSLTAAWAASAAIFAATQRTLAASTLAEPSGPPAWKTIPSWAVIGTADRVIPPALLQSMAQRAKARITDVNAGHLSLISRPAAVTHVIINAARATS
jgi:pimeloyl-ACP methyl ester carboxylesterase